MPIFRVLLFYMPSMVQGSTCEGTSADYHQHTHSLSSARGDNVRECHQQCKQKRCNKMQGGMESGGDRNDYSHRKQSAGDCVRTTITKALWYDASMNIYLFVVLLSGIGVPRSSETHDYGKLAMSECNISVQSPDLASEARCDNAIRSGMQAQLPRICFMQDDLEMKRYPSLQLCSHTRFPVMRVDR